MADVYRVHAELVLPIVRNHLKRVLAAQWVMLASGTTDSSTHVLLADMCTHATHKLCVHALRFIVAELREPKRNFKIHVEGGIGTVLGSALNVPDQPSISAQKLDSLVEEEVCHRVNVSLAPWPMTTPLYVPTSFTKTDVLAKMVLLACGALKVYLSKVTPHARCVRSCWRQLVSIEEPKSMVTCQLNHEETIESVTQILRKWTNTDHVIPKQEMTKVASGIVEMIIKDLHYTDSPEGARSLPPRPHFNLALVKDLLGRYFRSAGVDPAGSDESSRQRNFLNFCHKKFDELMCELEKVRYQCMLQDQVTQISQPNFLLTFHEIRSRVEDVFCDGAVQEGDGSIDVDGLEPEANRYSQELANKMFCYMTINRTPVQSIEVWRRVLEPIILEVDQKMLDNLQILMKFLEDSAKRFVQQLLFWLKMEPATRRNRANKLCGCLTDIHTLVTGIAGTRRRSEDSSQGPDSLTLDAIGDSFPRRESNSRTSNPENIEVHLQDASSPQDVTRDFSTDDEVTSWTISPENDQKVPWPDSPSQYVTDDSCPEEMVAPESKTPENTLDVPLKDTTRPESLLQDTTADSCADEVTYRGASTENYLEVCLRQAPRSKSPLQYKTDDYCSAEMVAPGSKTPEITLEVCLQENTPKTRSPEYSLEVRLQKDTPVSMSPTPDTISDSCSKVTSGTKSPQNKVEVCLQEDIEDSGLKNRHLSVIGESCPEVVNSRTESTETKQDLDVQEPKALDLTTYLPSLPDPPSVSDAMDTLTRVISSEIEVENLLSDTLLPHPPSVQNVIVLTKTKPQEMDFPRPKNPPPVPGGDPYPETLRTFSVLEDIDPCPLKTPPLDINLVQQGAVSTRSLDSLENMESPPQITTDQRCSSSQQNANLEIELDERPLRPPLEVSTSPFRPMCTVHEELLTLVDVLMVQLFAGLPKNLCRLVHSCDTLSTVHRVSKMMTGDKVLLSWTKLGPCKVNWMVKEVIRGLKHEFGSSQRLVDVFLSDKYKFDNVLFKLLMSKLESLRHKRNDTHARLWAVGGVFLSAFCMQENSNTK